MLKLPVLHPQILSALASAGHLGKILISDGNYPHNTRPNPRPPIVWANFTPGVVDAVTLLRLVCQVVPIEKVEVMEPARTGLYAMQEDPPIWADFRKTLAQYGDFTGELIPLQKDPFNVQCRSDDLCLVIASAETQIYANILLTIGVVR
jgi:L-fucose mutarotase